MKIFSLKAPFKRDAGQTHISISPLRLLQKYRDNERGIAAIEFAIIAPVMIGMYFGLAEIASAIAVDRRISHGTNVAGDLATQQPEITAADAEELVSAAIRVMDVQNVSDIVLDISSFILPAQGQPPEEQGRIVVNFSRGNSFGAYNASSLDAKLLNASSGVVVTRVKYEYTPLELRYFDSTITLDETFLLKPRRSDAVQIGNGTSTFIECTATSYSNVSCNATTS